MELTISKEITYRSSDRKLNQDDNMVRVVIDMERTTLQSFKNTLKERFEIIEK